MLLLDCWIIAINQTAHGTGKVRRKFCKCIKTFAGRDWGTSNTSLWTPFDEPLLCDRWPKQLSIVGQTIWTLVESMCSSPTLRSVPPTHLLAEHLVFLPWASFHLPFAVNSYSVSAQTCVLYLGCCCFLCLCSHGVTIHRLALEHVLHAILQSKPAVH